MIFCTELCQFVMILANMQIIFEGHELTQIKNANPCLPRPLSAAPLVSTPWMSVGAA